jgi:hypothetical protein
VTVSFPAEFSVTPAVESWVWQLHDTGPTDSELDAAMSPDRMFLSIASERLPTGMTAAEWLAPDPSQPPGGPAACFPTSLSGFIKVTVDGVTGYEHGGLNGCNFTEVLVVTGGRGYEITALVNHDTVTNAVVPPSFFDAWLATIHFDPASAVDPSLSPAHS